MLRIEMVGAAGMCVARVASLPLNLHLHRPWLAQQLCQLLDPGWEEREVGSTPSKGKRIDASAAVRLAPEVAGLALPTRKLAVIVTRLTLTPIAPLIRARRSAYGFLLCCDYGCLPVCWLALH